MDQKSLSIAKKRTSLSFAQSLRKLLDRFPDRSQKIIEARFGVIDGNRKTLEEIGKTYGITRERVRQIIDVTLRHLKRLLAEQKEDLAHSTIRTALAEASLFVSTESLLERLANNDPKERGALTVFLNALPETKILKENKERRECVVDLSFALSEWKNLMRVVTDVFQAKKDVMTLDELLQIVHPRFEKMELTLKKLSAYLEPSLIIGKNVFGRYGLLTWSAIQPRGTRERAYLILKMLGGPKHFRDLARLIDEYGLHRTGKKTHPQTVHNELIKDRRFVLIGRGIYALAEWGYERGTVREVLEGILRSQGAPMTRDAILSAILKIRRVKKSTVIINLNTFFTKVGKNLYTVDTSKK